jgi:hypothetical protein
MEAVAPETAGTASVVDRSGPGAADPAATETGATAAGGGSGDPAGAARRGVTSGLVIP